MKMREMLKHCQENKGICAGCAMNVNQNWFNDLTSWCLVKIREKYIEHYKKYKEENNELMAQKVMEEYKKLERKYLNT